MSNFRDAYTAVPSDDANDFGIEFLCGTLKWETSGIAILEYENATNAAPAISKMT